MRVPWSGLGTALGEQVMRSLLTAGRAEHLRSLASLSLFLPAGQARGLDFTLLWPFLPTIQGFTIIVFLDKERQTIDLDISIKEIFPLAR